MEAFKDKLKIQNLAIAICCFILAFFSFLSAAGQAGFIGFMQPAGGNSHWQSMWRGMIMGISIGVLIVMVIFLIRNILALRDDQKLKKLYVETYDEREIQIWTAARSTAMQIFLMGGLVAAIIAGYFSMTVSITIVACIFLQSITGFFCMLYFRIKL